jgi:hypothetical protein
VRGAAASKEYPLRVPAAGWEMKWLSKSRQMAGTGTLLTAAAALFRELFWCANWRNEFMTWLPGRSFSIPIPLL